MFSVCRDVFTGSLAQSGQEVWPIKLDESNKRPVRDLKCFTSRLLSKLGKSFIPRKFGRFCISFL